MSRFINSPAMRGEHGNQTIKRHTHTPITIDHFGIQASIKANGKVVFSKVVSVDKEKNEVEVEEIEIPASLVFKMAGLLKATRHTEYVEVQPVTKTSNQSKPEGE